MRSAWLIFYVFASSFRLFALDRVIEAGDSGIFVRGDVNDLKDSECQHGQKIPTDKAQVEDEKIELVALHDSAAFGDCLGCRIFRMVVQDEEGHRVRKSLNDARNEEEQWPQKCEQGNEDAGGHVMRVVGKAAEAVIKMRIVAAIQLHKEEC